MLPWIPDLSLSLLAVTQSTSRPADGASRHQKSQPHPGEIAGEVSDADWTIQSQLSLWDCFELHRQAQQLQNVKS